MPDTQDTVKVDGPYVEDENHVPDPTAQYGTLDTSGTAGSAHSRIEEVSPVFEVAARQSAVTAARAVDPDDHEVSESLVILPEEEKGRDEVIKQVQQRAKDAEAVNLASSRQTEAQQEAAEESDEGNGSSQETQQSSGDSKDGDSKDGDSKSSDSKSSDSKSSDSKSSDSKSGSSKSSSKK